MKETKTRFFSRNITHLSSKILAILNQAVYMGGRGGVVQECTRKCSQKTLSLQPCVGQVRSIYCSPFHFLTLFPHWLPTEPTL